VEKKERIGIINRIGDLMEDKCRKCENHGRNGSQAFCQQECPVGKELLILGQRLDQGGNGVKKETVKVKKETVDIKSLQKQYKQPSLENYQALKKLNLVNMQITQVFDIDHNHFYKLKKEWEKPTPAETKPTTITF